MSASEFYQIFSGFGRSLRDQQDREDQRSEASRLGDQLQGGDYGAAANTAFKAGDVNTGLNLLKLGLGQAQAQQATAAFGGLGSLYGGGASAQGGGLPALGQSSSTGTPSFLDQSGPQGDYLTGLFKRESNNDTMAQASGSSARGLGQFTKGTWNGVVQKYPELQLTPVTPTTDGRVNPEQMVRATKAFTAENEGLLAKSGLPVNDATRYSMHIFGSGGGRRFVAGTLSNPDLPASSYVNPDQVAANRPVFFNRDGTPKTAGQVMNDFARSFGGGSQRQAAAPQAPVQVASLDPSAGVSGMNPDRRPMQMPGQPSGLGAGSRPIPANAAADYQPPGGPSDASAPIQPPAPPTAAPNGTPAIPPAQAVMPQLAQAQRPASLVGQPPPSEIGVDANILNAPMRTAGVPQMAQARAAQVANALPPGLSGGEGRGPAASAPVSPAAPVPTLGGASVGRAMTMPGADGGAVSPEARAQVSAQAPQHLAQAGLPPQVAAPIGQMAPGSSQRVQYLLRLSGLPGLSDAQAGVVKSLLANELDQTKMPDDVKQYMFARGQGFTGSLVDYKNELRKPLTPFTASPGQAVFAPGERTPFYVAPRTDDTKLVNVPANTTVFDPVTRQPVFTAPGTDKGEDEASKISAQVQARRHEAPGLGLQEGTPQWRSYVATGKAGADRDMSPTEKKSIETADNAVLSAQQSIQLLERAKELSAKAYSGPYAKARGDFTGAFGNERGQVTTELDNLVTADVLGNLKGTFGGNPTEGERKIALEVAGSSSLPHALRVKIYQRMIDAAQLRMQQNLDRASQIREGTYYRAGSGPAAVQGAVAGGQGGAPALPSPSPSNRPGAVAPAARFQQLMDSGMTKDQAYQQLHSEGY